MDWNDLHENSELKLNLVNLIKEFDISQLVTTPTRDSNLLDLFFTDVPSMIVRVLVDDPVDNLDRNVFKIETICFITKTKAYTRDVFYYNI